MHGWWAISYVVLWLVVGVLSLLVVALARQIGVLHMRLGPRGALEMDDEGPPLGEAPPIWTGAGLEGRPVTIGGPGHPQLLLFVSPTCSICERVLPSVGPIAAAGRLSPIVIADASTDVAAGILRHKRDTVSVAEPELAAVYRIPGTPYAVVLDDLGVVRAKGTVNDLEQLEGLVETALGRIEDAGRKRIAG